MIWRIFPTEEKFREIAQFGSYALAVLPQKFRENNPSFHFSDYPANWFDEFFPTQEKFREFAQHWSSDLAIYRKKIRESDPSSRNMVKFDLTNFLHLHFMNNIEFRILQHHLRILLTNLRNWKKSKKLYKIWNIICDLGYLKTLLPNVITFHSYSEFQLHLKNVSWRLLNFPWDFLLLLVRFIHCSRDI